MNENDIEQVKNFVDLTISKGLKEEEISYRYIFHLSYIEKLIHKLIFRFYSKDDYLNGIIELSNMPEDDNNNNDISLLNKCIAVFDPLKKIKLPSQSSTDTEFSLTFYLK
jgi:hypothetical protein